MKTKVLHLIDTTGPGGAETVFVELASRTRDEGFNTIAVVRGDGWVRKALQERGVKNYVLDGRGSFKLGYLRSLIRLIEEEGVNVIQSHLLGSSLYSGMVALFAKRPVVATFHGIVDFSQDERMLKLKVALMNAGVSQYIAVSNSLKHALVKLKLPDVHVIYNGIDQSKYRIVSPKVLRGKLGLPSDAILVGALGNVRPAKAYDVLIRAASTIVGAHPRVHFVIAGDDKNSEAAGLKRLVVDLGIESRFHFVGFQADPRFYLGELDIFVLSSHSEGFSIATVEAQAAGLPVIATRSGGPEEIVEHEVNGLLVDCNAPRAIATSIELLLSSESLRRRLALTAQRTASERFSMDAMVKSYAELYEDLAWKSRATGR